MISGSSLRVEIGSRVLLSEASFLINPGEKVGLVGRNGTGKSSLISVIVRESPDHIRSHGEVSIRGTVAFLPQVPDPRGLGIDPNGFSHVLSARGLDALEDELTRAREQMEESPSEDNIQRFSDLEEQFRESGGYQVESIVAKLADGIGLDQELLLEDIASLSGGQRRRVDLIRVLFQEPDVMILDEPTNHLDLPAKRWLMDRLERFSGALLVVSHDLKLLDRSITKILHLSNSKLVEFKGTYSSYREQLGAEQQRSEQAALHDEKEIKRLSTLADQMRHSTNRRARIAKGLDKRVERLEASKTQVIRREKTSKFRLPLPVRSGAVPLETIDLSITYDNLKVLASVNMALHRSDRAVVIGRNGAGKSSLLRCLAGVQEPSGGVVKFGANVTLGYFAQEHEQVDANLTVLENIDSSILVNETERRSLLGSFGLSGKAVHQTPGTLSGGERAKLGLAMLAAGHANLLILDEPTNNLDPQSIVAIGHMLSKWPGTIVLVSHDRSFVSALEPTHALCLPEERYTYWKDEFLDIVEMK